MPGKPDHNTNITNKFNRKKIKLPYQHKILILVLGIFVLFMVCSTILSVISINKMNEQQNKKISTLLLIGKRIHYFCKLANNFNQLSVLSLKPLDQLGGDGDLP